jgi:diaphanous 1
VGPQKGLDALGQLLAGLVGKGGKKKSLGEVENTVLLEIVKCFRVLLNTDVSFAHILPVVA